MEKTNAAADTFALFLATLAHRGTSRFIWAMTSRLWTVADLDEIASLVPRYY